MMAAVSRARDRVLVRMQSSPPPARVPAQARAMSRPASFRGMSLLPWMRASRFQSVCAWRMQK